MTSRKWGRVHAVGRHRKPVREKRRVKENSKSIESLKYRSVSLNLTSQQNTEAEQFLSRYLWAWEG